MITRQMPIKASNAVENSKFNIFCSSRKLLQNQESSKASSYTSQRNSLIILSGMFWWWWNVGFLLNLHLFTNNWKTETSLTWILYDKGNITTSKDLIGNLQHCKKTTISPNICISVSVSISSVSYTGDALKSYSLDHCEWFNRIIVYGGLHSGSTWHLMQCLFCFRKAFRTCTLKVFIEHQLEW